MFIETIPNRGSPPAVLLREAYRDEHGRAQKRTLANLSKLPVGLIGGLKALLKGGTVIGTGPDEIQIERSLPHGHVAAGLGTIRRIALDRLILSTTKDEASRRHCDLVVAMIVDRLIAPRSKLGFVRAVDQETAISSLGSVLRLGKVKAGSRTAWRGDISRTACWCSTTSVRPTLRAVAVHWRAMDTAAITGAIGRRLSTGCSVRARGYRLRLKSLTAIRPTRRR